MLEVCKPLFSITNGWQRYAQDTIRRLGEFVAVRTSTKQLCLSGDARKLDILSTVKEQDYSFRQFEETKIRGIFTSPPYIGLIDYHEQHAYAYELLGLERQDDLEIGPKFRGQGKLAREAYIQSIAEVLNHCRKFLVNDFDIFLVANDKYDLYPKIAEQADMSIHNRYKRPVLNRTEKDKGAYAETIFHLRN